MNSSYTPNDGVCPNPNSSRLHLSLMIVPLGLSYLCSRHSRFYSGVIWGCFLVKLCHTFLGTLVLGFLMEIESHQAPEYWHWWSLVFYMNLKLNLGGVFGNLGRFVILSRKYDITRIFFSIPKWVSAELEKGFWITFFLKTETLNYILTFLLIRLFF